MIYMIPIMWDLLDEADQKILANFDYELIYSFWCYSFERINGILGSLPNNKHAIELELLRIIMQNLRLAAYDEHDFNELYQFMQIFYQNIKDTITGSEKFLGKMLTPRNRVLLLNSIYELLVKYYNDIYNWNFVSIADIASSDLSLENSN
ncbi:hypothetical protein GLOIN_2v1791391 [Rhizophagus clarus]|uniref:Uncharacterized protein n=1 Tax=Rhizophagus clarus TaxID=94130 RepID=A0A8H3MG17_9GLOM|nr:hypothetical protein GLOIN_2v1791391 [Rhizophagus clarus]